jgi:hypothetical protein
MAVPLVIAHNTGGGGGRRKKGVGMHLLHIVMLYNAFGNI